MPIKPENKKRYPPNWKEISDRIIYVRAGNRCEMCGVPNHAVGYRDEEGIFHPDLGNYILDCFGRGVDYQTDKMVKYGTAKAHADFTTFHDERGDKYFVIVLTTAHLDHTPENCEDSNLLALCQKCHNNYDQEHRTETIRESNKNGQLTLFK